jgi:hypothetical protein
MNDVPSPKPQHQERASHFPRVDEEEVALGWEGANPVLHIEAWLRDTLPPSRLEPF